MVDGTYCCCNAADVDEGEENEIDIKQKAFYVAIPINEIDSITAID